MLGDALGMQVHVISTDLTLADQVPALFDQHQRSDELLAAAEAAAADLARLLG